MLRDEAPNRGWEAQKWHAVASWPVRQDLWEECRLIYTDLAASDIQTDRSQAAEDFYNDHREEMDEGVELLDPVAMPIFACYRQIWDEGRHSFFREMQNEPRDPSTTLFDSSNFAYFDVVADARGDVIRTEDGRQIPLRDCMRRMIRWDPSTGTESGDYSAIVCMVRDPVGYCYVVDAWVRKAKVSEQIDAVFAMAERWGVSRASLESNGFQAILADPFRKSRETRREAGKFWKIQVEPEPSSENKERRISTLEVPIMNHWLQFRRGLPPECKLQMDDFAPGGGAAHDDYPDAVQGAYHRIGSAGTRMGGSERLV